MRLFLLLVFIALPLTACRRHTVIKPPPAPANTLLPGMFITADGNWRHQDKDTTLTLEVKLRSNFVDWKYDVANNRHGRGGRSGTGSLMNLASSTDPWFIYIEAPDRIWFFDGKDRLSYGIVEGNSFRTDASIHPGGKLEPKSATIPPEIIPRLPAELQKLLPAGEEKRKRPSI